jgi:hypothetical protein
MALYKDACLKDILTERYKWGVSYYDPSQWGSGFRWHEAGRLETLTD